MAQPSNAPALLERNGSNAAPTAAPASALQPLDLEKELSCSICTDILYQPLTLLDCLHTFCGACLKEWFGWQAKAAQESNRTSSSSIIYTCPSCRAPVRETRPNATVTTLLEMYLQANPQKMKSQEDRQEVAAKYKPGESVLPAPPTPPPTLPIISGRWHQDEETDEDQDERLLQQVREISLQDLDDDRNRRRRRSGDRSRDGGSERQPRHRRHQHRSRSHRREETSPHEAARRELESQLQARGGLRPGESLRSLERQGSLRTLISRSGSGSSVSSAVQDDILREISEGGLLDELDFSNIDPGDQEAVSELIARAYLARHPGRSSTEARQAESSASSTQANSSRPMPPVSRPHLLAVSHPERTRHNRSSSQGSSRSAHRHEEPRRSSGDSIQGDTGIPRSRNRSRDASATRHRARRRDSQEQHARHDHTADRVVASPVDSITQSIQHSQSDTNPTTPHLICEACSRAGIAKDLHHVCQQCPSSKANPHYTLCHRCYTLGVGCRHWFGFGSSSNTSYLRKAPATGYPPNHEQPHLMEAQRYLRSEERQYPPVPQAIGTQLASRRHRGLFCSVCKAQCNHCFWHCDTCNSGEYGFCNDCVKQAWHCTHPLQCFAVDHLHDPETPIKPPPTSIGTDLIAQPIHTTCNNCHNPIAPSNTRYHCPTCPDYDICSSCYHSMLRSGEILAAEGPRGWRKCPNGHRMLIIGFQESLGEQKRVVVENVVGGWRIPEEDTIPDHSTNSPTHTSGNIEGATSASISRTHRRSDSQSADPRGPGMPFATVRPSGDQSDRSHDPPLQDHSRLMRVLWARIPDEGPENADELELPKGAVISEVFELNETWSWGIYCRRGGLFPRAFAKEVR